MRWPCIRGKPSSVWLLLLLRALLQGRTSQLSFSTYVLIGCSVMSAFPLAVQLPYSGNGVPLEYLSLPLTTAEAWTSLPQIIFFPSGGTWAGRMGVRVGVSFLWEQCVLVLHCTTCIKQTLWAVGLHFCFLTYCFLSYNCSINLIVYTSSQAFVPSSARLREISRRNPAQRPS